MSNSNAGRFVWHELVTPDPKAALAFYGELFGWTTAELEMPGGSKYTMLKANGVDVGGAMATPVGAKVPPSWLSYATVDDVDAAAAKAEKTGGKVMSKPMDIPNVGRFAVVLDAEGAALAPFAPKGERALAEPPPVGHFCWDELITHDPDKALAFYEGIYGWTHEDKKMGPLGTYHVLKQGDRQAAGVMKAPMAQAPAAWLSYIATADVDEAAKRAERLKGKVIVPATDIPGIGRFAVLTDREGATFAAFKRAM